MKTEENVSSLENSLKLVNDYFVDKINKGDYEIEKITSYTAKIIIDKKYRFSLWIANESNSFRCYDGHFNSMQLDFNEKEKKTLFIKFNKIYEDEQRNPVLVAQRKAEYLKLKKEFESES